MPSVGLYPYFGIDLAAQYLSCLDSRKKRVVQMIPELGRTGQDTLQIDNISIRFSHLGCKDTNNFSTLLLFARLFSGFFSPGDKI